MNSDQTAKIEHIPEGNNRYCATALQETGRAPVTGCNWLL